MLKKLQIDGVWMEMEEDFKAKQLVMNLMGECHMQLDLALTQFPFCLLQPDKNAPSSRVYWIHKRKSVSVGI